jgi:hypothetical protein
VEKRQEKGAQYIQLLAVRVAYVRGVIVEILTPETGNFSRSPLFTV